MGTREKAQQAKASAAKPDNLPLSPCAHEREGEKRMATHTLAMAHT